MEHVGICAMITEDLFVFLGMIWFYTSQLEVLAPSPKASSSCGFYVTSLWHGRTERCHGGRFPIEETELEVLSINFMFDHFWHPTCLKCKLTHHEIPGKVAECKKWSYLGERSLKSWTFFELMFHMKGVEGGLPSRYWVLYHHFRRGTMGLSLWGGVIPHVQCASCKACFCQVRARVEKQRHLGQRSLRRRVQRRLQEHALNTDIWHWVWRSSGIKGCMLLFLLVDAFFQGKSQVPRVVLSMECGVFFWPFDSWMRVEKVRRAWPSANPALPMLYRLVLMRLDEMLMRQDDSKRFGTNLVGLFNQMLGFDWVNHQVSGI